MQLRQTAAARGRRLIGTFNAGIGAFSPATNFASGVGIDRTYLGRQRADKEYKPPPPRPDQNGVVTTNHYFGARVINLNSEPTRNAFSVEMIEALCDNLERLEANPAVTIVILQGANEKIFSSGTDMRALQSSSAKQSNSRGNNSSSKSKSSPQSPPPAAALALLQAQYRLHHLVATYTKPIVASMHGETQGSGWALAQHAQYSYVGENASISIPEVTQGAVPLGGASYHLSRIPDGVGMWAALTGGKLQGEEAYWAGMAQLFGTTKDLRETLVREAGAVSGDENSAVDLANDPVYQRAMHTLRDFRAENKLGWVSSNLSEDVSKEVFEEYVRLKRWYSYWVTGDRTSANLAKTEARFTAEETGDLFDLHQGLDVHGGRGLGGGGDDHPGSFSRAPRFAAAARRARIGALSAHAAAVFRGAGGEGGGLSTGPNIPLSRKLGLIRKCFGGSASSAVPTLQVAAAPVNASITTTATSVGTKSPAERRRMLLSQYKSLGESELKMPRDEKTKAIKFPTDIQSHIEAAEAHLEFDRADLQFAGSTSSSVELPASLDSATEARFMADAVRDGVETSWPNGQMTEQHTEGVLNRVFGAPPVVQGASAQAMSAIRLRKDKRKLLLRVAVARVTAIMRGLSPYVLADEALVTTGRNLNRKRAGAGGINAQVILGPSNFTIPRIESTDVMEESGPHAPGGIFPINPRLFTDPDGLFYNFNEDTDYSWSFNQGRWQGDVALGGDNDALPIRPMHMKSLVPAPVNTADGAGAAIAALRTEALRLLNVSARGGVEGVKTYVGETAKWARISTAGNKGDKSAAAQIAELRTEVFGRDGLKSVSRKLQRLRREEDGVEGVEEGGEGTEFDVAIPGDQYRRASAHVAWPMLASTLHRMRVIVYEGMCTQAFKTEVASERRPSPEVISELAGLAVDTPWGLSALKIAAGERGSSVGGDGSVTENHQQQQDPAVQHAKMLLNTWFSILRASQPSKDESSGPRFDASAPFTRIPFIRLDDSQKTELVSLASEFAKCEAAVLGAQSGGAFIEAAPGTSTPGGPRYTLASTVDSSTGISRLTVVRADVVSSSGGSSASSSSTTVSSSSSSSQGSRQGPGGAGSRRGVGAGGGGIGGSLSSGAVNVADMEVSELARRLADVRQQAHFKRFDHFSAMPGGTSPAVGMVNIQDTSSASSSAVARDLKTTGSVDFGSIGRGVFQQQGQQQQPPTTLEGGAAGVGSGLSSSARGAINAKLRYEQPIASERDATRAERASPSAEGGPAWWDFDVVLRALTDVTGHSVVGMFALPATGNTLAAGAMVVDHFRREADGRIALPQATSVAEIRKRLTDAAGRRANEDGATAALAAETLKSMSAAKPEILDATHSLLVAASGASLEECMHMEYRAMARLFGNEATSSSSSSSLFAPLADSSHELRLGDRSRAIATRRRRERAQATWERSLEAYLASGEGGGVFGDLFRRRYVYFKSPLGSQVFGETAPEVFAQEAKSSLRFGIPDAFSVAESQSSGPRGGGGGRFGGGGRRDDYGGDERVEAAAATIASKRAIDYFVQGQLHGASPTSEAGSTATATTAGSNAVATLNAVEEARFRILSGGTPAFLR